MSAITLRTKFRSRRQFNLAPLGIAMSITLLLAMALYPEPITPLAFAAIPVAGLACYYAPVQIVVLAVAISLFRLHEAYPFLHSAKLPLAFGALSVATLFLHMIALRTIRPYWERPLTYLAILIGCIILSTIFAAKASLAIEFLSSLYWKIIVLTVGMAWMLRKPDHFNFAARTFVLCGIALAARAIYNWFNGIALVEGGRVTIGQTDAHASIDDWNDPTGLLSTLGDPNDLALYLILPLSFAIATTLAPSKRADRYFGVLATILILMATVFTQSRGGLLGIAVMLSVIIYAVAKSRTAVIATILTGGLIFTAAIGLTGRVSGVTESAIERGLDESAQGRIDSWGTALQMALARPLVGVGVNNFIDSYYRYTDNPQRRDKAVHSMWFQIIGELGFMAFFIFVAMFATLLRATLTNVRMARLVPSMPTSLRMMSLASLGALAGFMVAGSFLTQALNWPLYIILAFAVATTHAVRAYIPANIAEVEQNSKLTDRHLLPVSHFTNSDPKSIKPRSAVRRAISDNSPSASQQRIALLKADLSVKNGPKRHQKRLPKRQ